MATTKKKTETKTPYVVVRTYSAGVHVGELVKRDGKEVTLARGQHAARDGGGRRGVGLARERAGGVRRADGGDRGHRMRAGR